MRNCEERCEISSGVGVDVCSEWIVAWMVEEGRAVGPAAKLCILEFSWGLVVQQWKGGCECEVGNELPD